MARRRAAIAIAVGALLLLGACTAWLLRADGTEPETIVILPPGSNGREATREDIAAFEAAWERCERSGAKCAIAIDGWWGTPPPPGWLTPIATR